jgi:CheY-like chemotaxis protein
MSEQKSKENIKIEQDEISIKEEYKIKSLYLAKCAHEIKNILISIISFIENSKITIEPISNIFNNNYKNNEVKESLSPEYSKNFLKSLCHFGMNLIYDVNRLSKQETKTINFEEEKNRFNINEALNFCVQMFESRCIFEKKNIKIKTSIKLPNNKLINSINQIKFKQVIINLLSNSYKFTVNGYIKISAIKQNDKIKITIKDTGVGFSENEMKNINSPFNLIKSNQYLNKNGSGLGLYITKEILSIYGSELKYESKKGLGTKFWFEIDDKNIIIDPDMIISNNFKQLINDINNGLKDKKYNLNTEKTESEIFNIKPENEFKQSSFKGLKLKKKLNSNLTVNKGKSIEMFHKNNKLLLTKNMLDFRMRNLNSTQCQRSFTLSTDNKSSNNTNNFLNNSFRPFKILICDDDRFTALSTQNTLLKYYNNNHKTIPQIIFAQNGIECLYLIYTNFIKDNGIDILLIDKNMPFIDGVSTCTLIKNIVEFSDIKIYMLSSDVNLIQCKVDGFFEKPISTNDIKEILKNINED